MSRVASAHGGPYLLRELEELQLIDVNLRGQGYSLPNGLDLAKLTSLKLIDCIRMQSFLRGLEQLLLTKTPSPLTRLHVRFNVNKVWDGKRVHDVDVMSAVEDVLRSATGLKDIVVWSCNVSLLSRDCVIRHGSTLKRFVRECRECAIFVR